MDQTMSYILGMSSRTEIDTHNAAVINGAQLIIAIEDLGFDDVDVIDVDSGYALTIAGVIIAIGIGGDPVEASEELLDQAADLFYYSTPTV